MPPRPLSIRHRRVIDFYFGEANFSWGKAAELMGYPHPQEQGFRISQRQDVQEEVEKRYQQMRRVDALNEEWVIKKLMLLASANVGNILMKLRDSEYDLSALTEDERFQISEFTEEIYFEGRGEDAQAIKKMKIKTEARLGPLIALCRNLGMFNDRVEVDMSEDLVTKIQKGMHRANKQLDRPAIDAEFEEVET